MNKTQDTAVDLENGFRFDRCLKGPLRVTFKAPMNGGKESQILMITVSHLFDFNSHNDIFEDYNSGLSLGNDDKAVALIIWQKYCKAISGYDGVPTNFQSYFLKDNIGRTHAIAAVNFLVKKLGFQEVGCKLTSSQDMEY